uniref:NAD(+) kinase n=1 Tax=Phallusia mammillata TaxID=59560 RepID=A0A6F9DMH4_9ASCI|nr:NAD kinase-like [Phallusia mammillata]
MSRKVHPETMNKVSKIQNSMDPPPRVAFSKPKTPKKNPMKRGRSLIGPLPVCNFGPKASMVEYVRKQYEIDPYDQKLKWSRPPENVLVIKKIDSGVNKNFKALVSWLVIEQQLSVYVEEKVLHNVHLKSDSNFAPVHKKLLTSFRPEEIDLIICLGGDGTLLYAASLFQQSMPPVIAFSSGSLGFLTSHKFENYRERILKVLAGNTILMLRSRLHCEVQRAKKPIENSISENGDQSLDLNANTSQNQNPDHCLYLVLNEAVVDRGSSHYLCNIDLYLEGRRITSVQGDGLIISTPTGSTAYAVAAGASMVHPNVPSIMVTPICPHSLSFRPIILPPGAELKFTVSANARGTASVCFDGRQTVTIAKGDYVTVRTSVHPAPCVCNENPFDDWFNSLSECLHWNSRQEQKELHEEE